MGTVRRTIKRDARAALKGRWSSAVLITLILFVTALALSLLEAAIPLVLGLPAYLQAVAQSPDLWQAARECAPLYLLFAGLMGLVNLLFFAPLEVGVADWYTGCTLGEQKGPGHVFWPFGCRKFWGALVLKVVQAILSLFWSVVFLAVPAGLMGLAVYNLYSLPLSPVAQTLTITGALAAGLLFLVMLLLLTVFLGRYRLALYLMGRHYAKGPFAALNRSVRLTKGHLFETFWLAVTLLPWQLISGLLLPALYALPYQSACWAMYTRYLDELYENKGKPVPLPEQTAEPSPQPEAPILPAPADEADPNRLFDTLAAREEAVDEVIDQPEAEPPVVPAVEEPTEEDIPSVETELVDF